MGIAKLNGESIMKKKTILYLRTDVFCNGEKIIAGGSVAHTLGVIEGFLSLQYEVIVAASLMHELLENLKLKKLERLYVPKLLLKLRWKLSCFISTFLFAAQSLKLLKKDASVDYIYQRYSILNATGVLLSCIKKIPLILEYNGSELWVDTFWAQKKLITFRSLIRFVEWLNIKYAHRIVVVSKPLRDELIQRGISRDKIIVNPNGVNTTVLNPALLTNERNELRHQLGIEESFVFGFIGTFSKWHGIEMLVAMIPAILAKKPQAHFLLIGDGPLFSYLQENLKQCIDEKKVTCTGLIAQSEGKKYLAACDAFLSPTQPNPDGTPFFGSPTKIFEYLSMGKPIIASHLDQVAEVIYPAFIDKDLDAHFLVTNQVGIVMAPTNENLFIQAACRLVDLDVINLEKMGLNARSKAIKEHDWQHHVEIIINQISL